MKHFSYLTEEDRKEIFHKEPSEINLDSEIELIRYSLGATLYMPATKEDLSELIIGKKYPQISSLVICLEDAIKDKELEKAEETLFDNLRKIIRAKTAGLIKEDEIPIIFIRVRNSEHLSSIRFKIKEFGEIICGFVFPKFDTNSGKSYLSAYEEINLISNKKFYFMPILESQDIMYSEIRKNSLLCIRNFLKPYENSIINIRIGSTDFCSLFGVRRGRDYTIYQIQTVRDCISDILNFFGRKEDNFVISGSVWEYFENDERFLKPQIRVTPFDKRYGKKGLDFRSDLIKHDLDGFIREVFEDKENGIIGKTVIHPSHINFVNSIYVVTHEEYVDALNIISENNGGGVLKSEYKNKMNEVKPHTLWASKILLRARVFGVFNKGYDWISIITNNY